eukprot:CAMPEP_0113635814 /NCGR_PEP_ID=MMETSP0017_2-20120614/18673_1 /TAXON_ID=2856 /ORGANISM="Cylindrotheca closterium" /LENGTH=230 /DNA_ID=CAMNT_0000546619 /DNA_START=99 /DNA_END=791 /DNA_ORIENTATION=- /assembly_acc=CAM_ASM_000147
MFHQCDDDEDEREWQLRVSMSRKRQRTKRKDDAAVAAFFSHVDDPGALGVLELLLDFDCSRNNDCCHDNDDDGDSPNFTAANELEVKQEARRVDNFHVKRGRSHLPVIQEDEDEEGQSSQEEDDDSEPTSPLSMTETDSSQGDSSLPCHETPSHDSHHFESSQRRQSKGVKSAKENMMEDAPNCKLPKVSEKKLIRGSLNHRRTPLYETKNQVTSSRQRQRQLRRIEPIL